MSNNSKLPVDPSATNAEWYDLPLPDGLNKLVEVGNQLRKRNLHNTEESPSAAECPEPPDEAIDGRMITGEYNDRSSPRMGAAGTRFGRNFPLKETRPPDPKTLLTPNPLTVSRELMTRDEFKPIASLNLLAAAWIQFMVHDWFVHKRGDPHGPDVYKISDPDHKARKWPVPRTPAEPALPRSKRPPAYANEVTHWWDASCIYGSDRETLARLRTGRDGKLRIDPNGRLLYDPSTGLALTGFTDNWWMGLALFHGLFTLEHNYVCDLLKAHHPDQGDDWLFQKAALVNAALLAKIHTIEWTLAIVPHRTIANALRLLWSGLAGEELQGLPPSLNTPEVLADIRGAKAEHYGVPYAMTEEFVSIYRMHPLIPDEFTFWSAQSGALLGQWELPDISGRKTRAVVESMNPADLLYSFGVMHPGAVTLHNYPKHLQTLRRDNGEELDLAAVDVLRDRERGVPRYNRFRRLLGKRPVRSWEELTNNSVWREQIKRVYRGDLESVDLMTGLYAEPIPPGFGFSETAFRLFILMATRRLKSDRFFTQDFTPEVYTPTGYGHVRANGLASVLLRHYPELAPALRGVANPFFPWNAVSGTGPSRQTMKTEARRDQAVNSGKDSPPPAPPAGRSSRKPGKRRQTRGR
jgi:hypothetical protein